MQEFSSISVSSYEAGSLAERLTEQSRDGWDVVAIVPTGSTVTAYLSRESSGESAAPAVSEPVADVTPAPVAEQAPEPVVEAAPEPVIAAVGGRGRGDRVDRGGRRRHRRRTRPSRQPEPEPATSWSALAEEAAQAEPTLPDTSAPSISIPEVIDPRDQRARRGRRRSTSPPAGRCRPSPRAREHQRRRPGRRPRPRRRVDRRCGRPGGRPQRARHGGRRSRSPRRPPRSSAAPAGWYADPSSRYELRYWDGTQWTEHVSRGGQQFTDPPVA